MKWENIDKPKRCQELLAVTRTEKKPGADASSGFLPHQTPKPTDILISDFQPPELWDNKFPLFRAHSVC